MDVVGITQHHDAITGTAKFHVADDYAWRVAEGIETSNTAYSALIDDLAQSAGISASSWQWCQRQNSTFAECPVADNTQSDNMVIATHNPSNVAMQTLEILVPHSNWKVQKLETSQQSQWVDTEANVLCN